MDSYIDGEGKEYTVNYVADENGYRAEGSHLPGSAGRSVQDAVQASSAPPPVIIKPAPLSKYIYKIPPQFDFNYAYKYGYPFNYASRYLYDPRYAYLF